MGRIGPDAMAKAHEKRRQQMNHLENLVSDALLRLGGVFVGRSMDLRKHIAESLKESQIKDAILRLSKAGRLRIEGADNSRKSYSLVEK